MSAETVPEDETEIQDLVLMFANSKIPRGSNAFQTLIDDFMKPEEDEAKNITIVTDSSDTTSSINDSNHSDDGGKVSPIAAPKSAMKSKSVTSLSVKPTKTTRMIASPRPKAQVHWPDENRNANLASTKCQMHHARLYMKTTPKPILKHDDNVLTDDEYQGHDET